MKKILILANNDVGLYNFRKELIQELVDKEFKVYAALPDGKRIKDLEKLGCTFIETDIDRRGSNPIKDLKLFRTYLKILKEVKPQVVLTYTVKPNIYGGIACRVKRIPYIINVTGLGSSFLDKGLLHHIVVTLSRISFRKAKKVFFQNTANRDLLVKQKIVKNNDGLIPGSGVNLNTYEVLQYPDETQPISFNFIARIMKDKGIDEYLQAATYIKKKYPSIIFNVIGMIDQSQYEEILKVHEEQGIIVYRGFQGDMTPLIKESSCTINPSYTEGMSNVLLESAASGRPVIASRIPGCQEIISEGLSGYTFEVKNTEDLIQQIEKFINLTYKQRVCMGILGREKVEKEFNREIVIKEYMKVIYESIEA